MNEKKLVEGMTRDEAVEHYTAMVHKQVHSAHTTAVCSYEDMLQVGLMAICEAYDSFDPTKSQFTTWVYHNIRNAIRLYQKENLGSLSGGNYLINKINQVNKNAEEEGEDAEKDIIKALEDAGVSHSTALAVQYIGNQYTCIDISEIGPTIADPNAKTEQYDVFDWSEWKQHLTPSEQVIMSKHFGFDGDPESIGEIAKEMNRSPRSISYAVQNALRKLRHVPGIENYAFDE